MITISKSVIAFLIFISFSAEYMADTSPETFQILARHIVDYNTKQAGPLSDPDNYRGEEGVLRLKPDVAEKLGLKVYIDQDYNDSVRLNKESEDARSAAEKAMAYQGKLESEQAISKKILVKMLVYKKKSKLAKEKLSQYKKNINKEFDERFNRKICNKIIITLLKEAFKKTNNNLRDALGYLYNKCQGSKQSKYDITSDNVQFVNQVFNGFIKEASPSEINLFDIDKNERNGSGLNSDAWKRIVKKDLPDLLPCMESVVKKVGDSIYRTDPLLFLSLMKRESSFNPKAVSNVGAAGLTQLMPYTAQALGLKNVYMPKYFSKAGEYIKKEREFKAGAEEMLLRIEQKEDIQFAKNARKLMLKSIETGKERAKLYDKYKKELISSKKDDRLDPSLAIEFGYTYFSTLLKSMDGDISLALASYNAGPHRVKEYKGIPPFDETVGFRNRVLQYYNDYLDRLDK